MGTSYYFTLIIVIICNLQSAMSQTTQSPMTTTMLTPTTTTATPAVSTSSSSLLTTSTTTTPIVNNTSCTATNDFNNRCSASGAYFNNGVCYSLLNVGVTYADAVSGCQTTYNGNVAVVRNADVAQCFGAQYDFYTWIQKPNNDPTIYKQLNNTVTSNGQQTLILMEADSPCLMALVNAVAANLLLIGPKLSCTGLAWALCETLPQFRKVGCDQALNRGECVVADTLTNSTDIDCGTKCALSNWCAGFNYNPSSQVCEILNKNTDDEELTCEAGWTYYERI